MEFFMALVGLSVIVGGLVAFGLAAYRWGIDTTDSSVRDPFLANTYGTIFTATRI